MKLSRKKIFELVHKVYNDKLYFILCIPLGVYMSAHNNETKEEEAENNKRLQDFLEAFKQYETPPIEFLECIRIIEDYLTPQ